MNRASEKREMFYQNLLKNAEMSSMYASKSAEDYIEDMVEKVSFYREAWMKTELINARSLHKICEESAQFFEEHVQNLVPLGTKRDESGYFKSPGYVVPDAAILEHLRALSDSLKFYSRDYSKLSDTIDQVFDPVHLNELQKVPLEGSRLQKTLAIALLRLDIYNASNNVLSAMNRRMPRINYQLYTGYMPTLSMEKRCIRKGEYFEADFFAMAYSKVPDAEEIFVNGQAVKIHNGLGSFQMKYTTPGVKTIKTELRRVKLRTGDTMSITRGFGVKIIK